MNDKYVHDKVRQLHCINFHGTILGLMEPLTMVTIRFVTCTFRTPSLFVTSMFCP